MQPNDVLSQESFSQENKEERQEINVAPQAAADVAAAPRASAPEEPATEKAAPERLSEDKNLEVKAPEKEAKFVRESITYGYNQLSNLYSSYKEGVVTGAALRTFEWSTSWATKPLITKVTEVSDPWIDMIDTNVVPLIQDRVITPAMEKCEKDSPKTAIAVAVVKQVQQETQILLHNKFSVLMDNADDLLDDWIPEKQADENEEEEEDTPTVRSISLKFSTRLKKKLRSQLQTARNFKLDDANPCNMVAESSKKLSELVEPMTEYVKPMTAKMSSVQLLLKEQYAATVLAITTFYESHKENMLFLMLDSSSNLSKASKKYGLGSELSLIVEKSRDVAFVDTLWNGVLVRLSLMDSNDEILANEKNLQLFIQALQDSFNRVLDSSCGKDDVQVQLEKEPLVAN